MPTFKKNPSPAMKKSAYKMKYSNSAFPFKSAVKKLDDPSAGNQGYAMENEDNDKKKKKKKWSKKGAISAIPGALSTLGAAITNATSI